MVALRYGNIQLPGQIASHLVGAVFDGGHQRNQPPDRHGGFDPERIVRDHRDSLVHQEPRDVGPRCIVPHQHGDVSVAGARSASRPDGFQHGVHLPVLVAEGHLNASRLRVPGPDCLFDIGVNCTDQALFPAILQVQLFGGPGEEPVIEGYDGPQAPPVFLQRIPVIRLRESLFYFGSQQVPVRTPPPVDTLLDVADNQVVPSVGIALG